MEGYHKSVLLKEVIEALEIKKDHRYLDLTLGDGGHSREIIRLGGRIVGVDADPQALERVRRRFEDEGVEESRFRLISGNFRDIKNLILLQTDTANQKFAGAIFDLGVSSLQLESPERGFSFSKEGPLDMRLDPGLNVTALDLLNVLTRKELYELFASLGEEERSWGLAGALVRAREVGTVVKTTKDLARLVEGVYKRSGIRDWKIHPATRVFQALRIAVNDELGALKEGLNDCLDLIEKNGTIVVISFHSLEDRIVKDVFKDWQVKGYGEIVTKKPVIPEEREIEENPRSRSAKMRIFKKL